MTPVNRERVTERRHLIEASKELGRVDLRLLLPRISAPTVVFAPARDGFVRGDVAGAAAAVPNARLIPNTGRWTPVAGSGAGKAHRGQPILASRDFRLMNCR
jgi:pimeloyl-ACP methyl ester carboxylesterase